MANMILFSNNELTLEAAEADLDRLLTKESSLQLELNKFKKKVADLRTERHEVSRQCRRLNHFVAKKLCRNFVNKFYATLPPELRDMVYDHVWDERMLRLVFHDVTRYKETSNTTRRLLPFSRSEDYQQDCRRRHEAINIKPWSVLCMQDACCCFQWWELPFWVQHQFVGMNVAIEVAKAYYRNLRDPRMGSGRLDYLIGFLSQDHFHLGVKPADYIRRLELPLDQDAYIKDYDGLYYDLQSSHGQDIFESLLGKLLEDGYLIHCMPALGTSHHIANKLLKEGAKVTVLAWDKKLRKEYDVSDYYDLEPEDWQAKWIRKVIKGHRRSGFVPFGGLAWPDEDEDLDEIEDTMDTTDSEAAAEQERREDEQDESFVRALSGRETPSRSDPMPYTRPNDYVDYRLNLEQENRDYANADDDGKED